MRIFPDPNALSVAAADEIALRLTEATKARGIATMALSGGNTPRLIYAELAKRYADKIDWSLVRLFWGDERFVPEADPSSNYRMVQESLISRIEIPSTNIYPIPTAFASSTEAARAYDRSVKAYFGNEKPEFDIVLLGLGLDGHTASIFPKTPIAHNPESFVIATVSPVEPANRISLTMEVINLARTVIFLISGIEKAAIFAKIMEARGTMKEERFPAARVSPSGDLLYFVDQAALMMDRQIIVA